MRHSIRISALVDRSATSNGIARAREQAVVEIFRATHQATGQRVQRVVGAAVASTRRALGALGAKNLDLPRRVRLVAAACSVLAFTSAGTAIAAPQLSVEPTSLQLVSSRRIGRTLFEYTLRVAVVNAGTPALAVGASVTSSSPATVVVDPALSFGDVGQGGRVASTDTFTLRHDRSIPFDARALTWTFVFEVPSSGSFDFALDVPATAAYADASAAIGFGIERDASFLEPVTIGLSDPPEGITAQTLEIGPGASGGSLVFSVAPDVPVGDRVVTVSAAAGATTRTRSFTLTVRPAEPRAQQKIAAALAAGEIDATTALFYRAYAFFGDPRLPEAFAGSGSVREDRSLVAEIEAALPSLDPQTRELLLPFTLRPAAEGSWYERARVSVAAAQASTLVAAASAASSVVLPASCAALAPFPNGWISRASTAHPVRVWMRCDSPQDSYAEELIDDTIALFDRFWTGMTNRMGTAPIPDRSPNEPLTAADGKGDDKIDVYIMRPADHLVRTRERLAPPDAAGQTVGSGGGFKTSAYILLPLATATATDGLFHTTAIHEFMHVLQFAHNAQLTTSDWWYVEASARWAEAHFDRIGQPWSPWSRGRAAYDQVYRPLFVGDFQQRPPAVSLNEPPPDDFGSFIWAYYMEQRQGAVVPAAGVWTAVEGAFSARAADQAMTGAFPFGGAFREFAVRNFNQELLPGDPLPRAERYVSLDPGEFRQADGQGPAGSTSELVVVRQGADLTHPVAVESLAAQYAQFVVDPRVPKVTFDFSGISRAGIDAFVKMQDTFDETMNWERRDYTGESRVTFCRSDPKEALQSLILVLSNPELEAAKIEGDIRIKAHAEPCARRWVGTVAYDQRYLSPPNAHQTMSANLTWVLDDAASFPGLESYYPTGNVKVERFEANGCVAEIEQSSAIVERGWGGITVNRLVTPPELLAAFGGGSVMSTITDCDGNRDFLVFGMPFFPDQADIVLNDAGDRIDFSGALGLGPSVSADLDLHYHLEWDRGE